MKSQILKPILILSILISNLAFMLQMLPSGLSSVWGMSRLDDVSQTETPTIDVSTSVIETTLPTELAGTETPTPAPILTEEPSSPTSTTFDLATTETPTPSVTAISPTPTRTRTPKSQTKCSFTNVYASQMIVKMNEGSTIRSAYSYDVVDRYTDSDGYEIVVLQPSAADFCALFTEQQGQAGVISVEPNYAMSMLETIPNDPGFAGQYYLNNIQAPEGWDISIGSASVTIAVIDSGVDTAHTDLASKIVAGYDFVDDDSDPQDANGHGTMVAGIAAASANNGVGIAGVSWRAKIMPLRVLDSAGNGSYANVAEAIIWATDHGARVINLSLGGRNYSEVLEDAVNYAVAQGVVLVAATGNSGATSVLYPAAFAGVIGVGATDSANHLASFSNTGTGVDVVAPGVSILSTYPGNLYYTNNGTSFSSPQVAGFAALLLGFRSMQYSSDVVAMIESSALDLGATGYDTSYGYGLIQIGPALQEILKLEGTATPTQRSIKPTKTALLTATLPMAIPTQTSAWVPGAGGYPSATPTEGEVFMLGGETTPTPTLTLTGEQGMQPSVSANEGDFTTPTALPGAGKGQSAFPVLLVGILCLVLSGSIFLIYRKLQ